MTSAPFHVKPELSAERRAFYEQLATKNLAPLWEVLGRLVTAEPATACVPVMWRYDEIRQFLLEAGKLITAKEAERRVLVLENPGFKGAAQITQSLYAGVQMVLPGEIAPSHRHVASCWKATAATRPSTANGRRWPRAISS
jgi:gentisate 1,2-dioxygenase